MDYFKIGFIAKTHGLKGEVTAVTEMELKNHTTLFVELNGGVVPYSIEKISGQLTKPFLKLDGIDSLEQATALKGKSIYVVKSARAKLKRGEFYDDEVIGFVVTDKTVGVIGKVKETQTHGGNRLLVISGAKEILVPINAPFIKHLNKTKKTILLELPEGFLEM